MLTVSIGQPPFVNQIPVLRAPDIARPRRPTRHVRVARRAFPFVGPAPGRCRAVFGSWAIWQGKMIRASPIHTHAIRFADYNHRELVRSVSRRQLRFSGNKRFKPCHHVCRNGMNDVIFGQLECKLRLAPKRGIRPDEFYTLIQRYFRRDGSGMHVARTQGSQ
jgi:hypothetical protein